MPGLGHEDRIERAALRLTGSPASPLPATSIMEGTTMKGPATPGGGHYRCVSEMTASSVRIALPDGWDARQLPARCDGESVQAGGWEAISQGGSRVRAGTPEALLARVWATEARAVDPQGQGFDTTEAA